MALEETKAKETILIDRGSEQAKGRVCHVILSRLFPRLKIIVCVHAYPHTCICKDTDGDIGVNLFIIVVAAI